MLLHRLRAKAVHTKCKSTRLEKGHWLLRSRACYRLCAQGDLVNCCGDGAIGEDLQQAVLCSHLDVCFFLFSQLVHLPQDPPTQKTQIKQQVSTTNITNTQERIISRPVQQVQVQQVQVQQPVQQVQQQVVQQVVQQPAQVQQVQVQQLPQGAVLTQ